jgi:hypothetical protein
MILSGIDHVLPKKYLINFISRIDSNKEITSMKLMRAPFKCSEKMVHVFQING